MKPFEPEWSVFLETPSPTSQQPCRSYRYPRHMAPLPGQRCHRDRCERSISPVLVERLRHERVRTQLAAQFGTPPALV